MSGPGRFDWTDAVAPVCQIGLSATRAAEPDSWLDVSCYVHEAELFRGRERFTERFQPGTASITFTNENGWGDVHGNPADVIDQILRPGRPIRIGVLGPWGTRWLWRGWIDQAKPTYDPTLHDIVTITCIDALAEAGTSIAPAGPLQGDGEFAHERVGRVLNALEWFSGKRKIGTSTTRLQVTDLGEQGIDLLGQAADSDGGVVFGDTDGDVVFKNRDWMLYDPDDPPDATIGNVDPSTPGTGYVPGYLDPERGYVYFPDPPPFTTPTTILVCADGEDGVLIEQGTDIRMWYEDGLAYLEMSGHVWDLGSIPEPDPETGIGCMGVTIDGDEVHRVDGDPDDGWTVNPFPIPEMAPAPPPVELIAWLDRGADTLPAVSTTPGPITPGAGCVIAVLLNAIGFLDVPSTGLQATVSGGGLTWIDVWHRDAPDVGASGWIWVAEIGRDADPGSFSPHISWDGSVGSYICTVWRCTHLADDFVARCIDGSVLQAVTNSNPPDEIEPGKGPNSATLESRNGTVDPPTALTDVTIAQSLAQEDEGPFGAVFDDSEGAWVVVPPEGSGGGSDDFERPDGPLGLDWITPDDSWFYAVPMSISDGAAVAPEDLSGSPGTTAGLARTTAEFPGDQFIEVEITQASYGFQQYYYLEVHRSATDATAQALYLEAASAGWYWRLMSLDAGGDNTDHDDGTVSVTYPAVVRLESLSDGTLTATINGTVIGSVAAGPLDGGHLTFGSSWSAAAQPRFESVVTPGGTEWCDDFERADGPLGDDWEVPPVDIENYIAVLPTITGGNAVGPPDFTFEGTLAGAARWAMPLGDGNQYIEVVVGGLRPHVGSAASEGLVWLFTQMAADTGARMAAYIFQQRNSPDDGNMSFGKEINSYDSAGDFWNLPWHEYTNEPVPVGDPTYTIRLESDTDGAQRLFVDGALVGETTAVGEGDVPQVGPYAGFQIYSATGSRPFIEQICIGTTASGVDGVDRKSSWVAGYRMDAVATEVAWTEVNLGPSDIQSTQAALVVDCSGTDNTDLVIGGLTDPFNGPIYSAERREGTDPNGGELVWAWS